MQLDRKEPFKQCAWSASKLSLILLILWANSTGAASTPIESTRSHNEQAKVLPSDQLDEQANEAQTSFSLIDWHSYKKLFNKNYSSIAQQLVRQRIFMSKQIQVFLASAKWRLTKQAYFTSINQFSDLTPDEEHRKLSGDSGEWPSDDEDDEQDDMMDDEQIERALLKALEENQAAGLNFGQRQRVEARMGGGRRPLLVLSRQKRSLMANLRRSLSISDLVRVPSSTKSDEHEEKADIRWVVPSNNPHYEPVDTSHLGPDCNSGEQADSNRQVQDIPEEELNEVDKASHSWLSTPVSKIIGSVGNSLSNSARNKLGWTSAPDTTEASLEPARRSTTDAESSRPASDPNDKLIVDWRQSGCVAAPLDQKECQSCYAISSMAFLEWAFCMNQDRVLTPLSVQYMISCGPQYKLEADPALKIQFYGCNRGRSRQAMYFVKEYGAELAAHMPYLARDTECPIKMNAPLKTKGYIRPNVKQHVRMSASTNQLELALEVGPVIVNFREPVDFLAYGGGMVGGCYQQGGHAMLVVGHGVENDTPYLLIKNSFGTSWGMNGYFKFDRKYTLECVKDFILPRVSFPSKRAQVRRVKAYLAKQQSATAKPNSAFSTFDLDENFDVGAGGLFSVKE